MRRRYLPENFVSSTNYIRKKMPDASIGTDIMVGFPNENEENFKKFI